MIELHDIELHVCSVIIITSIQCFVGKPEGKRQLGRPRRRWEGNRRMDVGKIGWEGVDWLHMAQSRDQ